MENFTKFTERHLNQSVFLVRDSSASISLWILRNFSEQLFYKQKQSSGDVLLKGVLRDFAKFRWKHLCQCLFFNKSCRPQVCNSVRKETLAQVFSCEFSGIFKNAYYYRTPVVAASVENTYEGLPGFCCMKDLPNTIFERKSASSKAV